MTKFVLYLANHSLVRFGIVGFINTAIDLGLFFLLYGVFGWNIIPANVTSFTAAVTNSYFLNKWWSFSSVDSGSARWSQFIAFVIVSIVGLVLNTSILVLGEPYAPVPILKLAATLVTPLFNYLSYRFIIFRSVN